MCSVQRTLRAPGAVTPSSLSQLLSTLPRRELRALCAEALEPIAEHDRRTGGELLRTLELFVRCGTVAGAARELSTHRNTVRQRIQRIERLLRADLNDPERRLYLSFALHCRRALAGAGQTRPPHPTASGFGHSAQTPVE